MQLKSSEDSLVRSDSPISKISAEIAFGKVQIVRGLRRPSILRRTLVRNTLGAYPTRREEALRWNHRESSNRVLRCRIVTLGFQGDRAQEKQSQGFCWIWGCR